VGKAVAKIIALALDLDETFFDQPKMFGEPIATLRLLHYGGIVWDLLQNKSCNFNVESHKFRTVSLCSMKVKYQIPQKDYMELELTLTMV